MKPITQCPCYHPPFYFGDFNQQHLGIEKIHHGEVDIETCKSCGTLWLKYFVENEAFTASGRWFRGVITEKDALIITPENAVSYLESLPWYFAGGCFFNSAGFKRSGNIF